MKRLTITIAMLVAAALAAPAADASSRQLTIMQDDAHVRGAPDATLDEFAALGVDIVKLNLYWDEVAPGGRRKPAGFDGASPGAYSWGSYENAVRAILARGMQPFLSIGGRAPDWASRRKGRRGTYRPSAKEFRLFAEATGRKFPDVRIWSIWNEPNLYSWLSPQRRRGIPQSPSIYRGLYLAGYRGLDATGHGDDTILLGELMPRGGTDARKVPPLAFLREMACLDSNFRQYRGRAAKRRRCRKVGRFPTSGLAYHPYTLAGGPAVREAIDDAAIGQLSRVRKTLDALARRGKLPRRLPIWITEFGYQTKPPDRFATPLRRAPKLMDLSEWIAYRNPRVHTVAQYKLADDPIVSGFQSGLRFSDGALKPAYAAYRMPLWISAKGAARLRVYGQLRPLAAGAPARVELQNAPLAIDAFTTIATFAVRSGNGTFLRTIPRFEGRFRLRWAPPGAAPLLSRSAVIAQD
jgi:hypothetical protein